MRPLRLLPGIAIALLALAGMAAAVAINLNADHSTTLDDKTVSGSHALSANEGGASANVALDAGAANLAASSGVTLPAVPETPALPAVPTVPTVPPVGVPSLPAADVPEVPETPKVGGSANAEGAASATTDHASANGHGAANVNLG